eukprot:637666_1
MSGTILPTSTTNDQRNRSSSLVKSEFVSPDQPPKAASSCEYCGTVLDMKQCLTHHGVEIRGHTCVPAKRKHHPSESVTSESSNNSFQCEDNSLAINIDVQSVSSSLNPSQFECNLCQKVLNYRHSLEIHQKSSNCIKKQFICDMCSTEFQTKTDLEDHSCIRSKKFSCTFCQAHFEENGNLQVHLLMHSKENTYSCKICEQDFSEKKYLIR